MRLGLPPLCRCVLLLARGGAGLCTAWTALRGEREGQAESAEEHDSVLRVPHPCVGSSLHRQPVSVHSIYKPVRGLYVYLHDL